MDLDGIWVATRMIILDLTQYILLEVSKENLFNKDCENITVAVPVPSDCCLSMSAREKIGPASSSRSAILSRGVSCNPSGRLAAKI